MTQLIGQYLQPLVLTVLRLSAWLTVLVVIFVPLERLFDAHPQKILRKGIGADLCYYLLNSVLPALLLGGPIGLLAWLAHSVIPSGVLAATAALPLWARLLAGLVVGEVGYYWGHRLSHEIPYLWRFHSIHHSAEELDFLVNSRGHPVDVVWGRFCALAPLAVLGLGGPLSSAGSLVPILVSLIGIGWSYFIHANLRWRFGPLEWLVTTPGFHHWHHSLCPTNKNYASTLPWLDRIFGTHYLPREFPTAYGIKSELPESIAGQLIYPLLAEAPAVIDAPAATAATEPVASPNTATVTIRAPLVADAGSVECRRLRLRDSRRARARPRS